MSKQRPTFTFNEWTPVLFQAWIYERDNSGNYKKKGKNEIFIASKDNPKTINIPDNWILFDARVELESLLPRSVQLVSFHVSYFNDTWDKKSKDLFFTVSVNYSIADKIHRETTINIFKSVPFTNSYHYNHYKMLGKDKYVKNESEFLNGELKQQYPVSIQIMGRINNFFGYKKSLVSFLKMPEEERQKKYGSYFLGTGGKFIPISL